MKKSAIENLLIIIAILIVLISPLSLIAPCYGSETLDILIVESYIDYMVVETKVGSVGIFKNTQATKQILLQPSFAELLGVPETSGFNI
jgi:hypothetical protein